MNRFSTQQNGMTNSFFFYLAFIAFWKRALHIYIYTYTAAQKFEKFGISKMFYVFFKEVSSAHQGCIYLIKNTEKNVYFVKYY